MKKKKTFRKETINKNDFCEVFNVDTIPSTFHAMINSVDDA